MLVAAARKRIAVPGAAGVSGVDRAVRMIHRATDRLPGSVARIPVARGRFTGTTATRAQGAVVITGTSSGIGRACAIGLADAGFHVFAGVRKDADGEALRDSTRGALTPIFVDVTDAAAVQAAAEEVARAVGGDGIAGLVNNAGIGVTWPMEAIPSDLLRVQYDINVFGQVTVIQAFMPLLRLAAGRIINIGSIGDRLTMPFGGALTSSKWALASITEALRLELRPWGIHVVLIEPASIHTEAVDKMQADADRTLAQLDEIQRQRYADAYRSMTRSALARERTGSSPDVVATSVIHALTTKKPKTRYLVGKHARALAFIARWAPDPLFDQIRVRLFGLPREFGAMRAQDTVLLSRLNKPPL
jgi:NAD(P)-dependent dehydrogenase (short-subunit alcohol dehydrogenase family)